MSRPFIGTAVLGLAFAASAVGASHAAAAAPAEEQQLPVCVSLSVAGLDADQLCKKK